MTSFGCAAIKHTTARAWMSSRRAVRSADLERSVAWLAADQAAERARRKKRRTRRAVVAMAMAAVMEMATTAAAEMIDPLKFNPPKVTRDQPWSVVPLLHACQTR